MFFFNVTKNRIFCYCALYFIIKRSGKSLSQDFATKSTINNVKLLSNCKSKRQHVKGIVAVLWFLVVDREQLANEEQPQKQRCCCQSQARDAPQLASVFNVQPQCAEVFLCFVCTCAYLFVKGLSYYSPKYYHISLRIPWKHDVICNSLHLRQETKEDFLWQQPIQQKASPFVLFLRQRVELGTRERQRDPKSFDKQEKSLLFDKSREEPSSDKNSFDMKQ